MEAPVNAAGHGGATSARVEVEGHDGQAAIVVTGHGRDVCFQGLHDQAALGRMRAGPVILRERVTARGRTLTIGSTSSGLAWRSSCRWRNRRSDVAISLVLADDHQIVLEGLAQLFRVEPDFHVVARCTDGEETLRAVRHYQPDILVLDLRMPGEDGGHGHGGSRRVDAGRRHP